MNQSSESRQTEPSATPTALQKWLSYRRKRFWLLLLLLLYTLSGFVVLPMVIENQVGALFEDQLGRKVRIENIDVNPYVLSLNIQGFELDDKDQVPLATFERFFVNFQLSSLFNRAWTFDEISLEKPFFLFERFNEAESRLSSLITDFAALSAETPEKTQDASDDPGMPRLLVHRLNLVGGRVDVKDKLPDTVVETRLSPINIAIEDLNTLPDRAGNQSVTIQLADGASLSWEGSLSLSPLLSEGQLQLENLKLDPAVAYLKSTIPMESLSATLSTRLKYRIFMDFGGQADIDIDDLSVQLKELGIVALEPATELLEIADIQLGGGQLRFPEQQLSFNNLKVANPHLVAWLNENGTFNLLELMPESAPADNEVQTSTQDAGKPWLVSIDAVELIGGRIEIEDRSVQPTAAIDIVDLGITMNGVNNQAGTRIPVTLENRLLQGGSIRMDGNLVLLPDVEMSGRIVTNELPLSIAQPYVGQLARVEIKDGKLQADIEVGFTNSDQLKLAGELGIPELNIHSQLDDSTLLSWQSLDIDRFEFQQSAHQLSLSQLTFEKLYGILVMDEEKVTNITKLLIEQAESTEQADSDPLDLVIGGIAINNSSMDFSDLSLPLPFATYIINLNGNISIIDNTSDVPANIELEGQVDEYGLAIIKGSMDLFDPVNHTGMKLSFRNLQMSNLSPYTVEFAGREIDQGKLDLQLGYDIDKGMLKGTNNVVLSDLVLGQKVDHPGAASLPLGLAVSLLKDSDGVIKVDLPVEGDINDPEFQIGGVIWTAVSGFIGKIVSAPFKLLGNLIGAGSEDLGQFEFLPGRFDLTPPELEKIAQLKQALEQRPQLVIEVAGVTDPRLDTTALKRSQLIDRARAMLGEDIDTRNDQTIMRDERIRQLVETMFKEQFPDVDTGQIRAGFSNTEKPTGELNSETDELAYANALWERLVEAEPVSADDLKSLATARAQSVTDAFMQDGSMSKERVITAEPVEVESEDNEWVVLKLSVAPQ